jgi:hypothetical protein
VPGWFLPRLVRVDDPVTDRPRFYRLSAH